MSRKILMMARCLKTGVLAVALTVLSSGCGEPEPVPIVLYSGQSESLVEPIVEQYRKNTELLVTIRYGDSAELAAELAAELVNEAGETSADLFWARDAGAFGSMHAAGLLAPLPDSILFMVPGEFRSGDGSWVGTSGRARTIVYSVDRLDTTILPRRLFDLVEPSYQGRIGWAPSNPSFQTHVTALRLLVGEDSTRQWLNAMIANGTKAYRNHAAIIQAISDGEIDLGLSSHQELYRVRFHNNEVPVDQTLFEPGDPGNLLNVAGIGVLEKSDRSAEAVRFVRFLLSQDAQRYFARETFEYPVISHVEQAGGVPPIERIYADSLRVHPDDLNGLETTRDLLRSIGLL